MKSTQKQYPLRASVIAVHAALVVLALTPGVSVADSDEEIRELTQPSSQIEVGVGNVSDKSAKFGEFNGMFKDGAYFIGNFDLRGGAGDDSTFRWRANGSNLGLENRNLGAEFGNQGRYRFNFGYDEINREATDSFKTIYNGFGTSTLTLPSAYPAAATRLAPTATNANQVLSNWSNLQSPYATEACAAAKNMAGACAGPGVLIPALMQNPGDLATKRTRGNAAFSFRFDREWEFKASVRREDKEGTKLTGFGVNGPGRGIMLPEPINSTTDIYEAGLVYVGKSGHMNFGYTGSSYKNAVNLWTAQNPFQNNSMLNNIAQLTGAPDNQMHQFNLSGGFNFTPKTKLVLAGSYTRMTQNEAFGVNYPAPTYIIPESSANAKVINTSFLARLTSQPMKDLRLNVAYKYDNRDNETPSNLYSVPGGDSALRTFANEPFNRRQQRLNVDADYSLGRGKALAAGFELHEIGYSSSHGEIPLPSEGNKEDTWRLEYRSSMGDSLTGRVAYARSDRRMEGHYHNGDPLPLSPVVSEDLAPLIAAGKITVGAGGVITTVAPFAFPAADPLLPGFRQFFLADRNRDKLRGTLNFVASEKLSLDGKLDLNRDEFKNSQWGLRKSESWVLGLDAGYRATDNVSLHANYTYEDMKSNFDTVSVARLVVANPQVTGATTTASGPANTATTCAGSTLAIANTANNWLDPCRRWGMQQADKVDTVGLGFKAGGLMGGRLQLDGDLVYSRSRSPITVNGGMYTTNGTTNVWYAAQSLPEIVSTVTELRLAGQYKIDKAASLRLSYLGQHLSSADFQLDAYTNPIFHGSFLSTGMTSPVYTVHVLGVSYLYSFR